MVKLFNNNNKVKVKSFEYEKLKLCWILIKSSYGVFENHSHDNRISHSLK